MTTAEFIQKWRATELKKRSASQEHFLDLEAVSKGVERLRFL